MFFFFLLVLFSSHSLVVKKKNKKIKTPVVRVIFLVGGRTYVKSFFHSNGFGAGGRDKTRRVDPKWTDSQKKNFTETGHTSFAFSLRFILFFLITEVQSKYFDV